MKKLILLLLLFLASPVQGADVLGDLNVWGNLYTVGSADIGGTPSSLTFDTNATITTS